MPCSPFSYVLLHCCSWALSIKAGFLSSLHVGPFGKCTVIRCPQDMVRRHFVPTSLFPAGLNTSANLLPSPIVQLLLRPTPPSVSLPLFVPFLPHLSLCVQLNDPRDPPLSSLWTPVSFKSLPIPLNSPYAPPPSSLSLPPSSFFPSSLKAPWIKTMQSVFLAKDRD